jgi:hypothetical protein
VSKKKYKNALGGLYKRKIITISPEKIALVQSVEDNKVEAKAPTKKSSSIWG